MIWIELVVGLVLLLAGGEALVKGSVGVATHLGVSPLLIGLTLVGFGTSTPELVASIEAVLIGSPAIAIGNIVGSNIANVLLILGLSAVILPIATTKEAFRRDGTVLIGASLLFLGVVLADSLGRWCGVVFLLLLASYTSYTYLTERRSEDAAAVMHTAGALEVVPRKMALLGCLVLCLGGIAGVVAGATFLVQSGMAIAATLGLSEAVIGLTLVAVGTSLPEMVTSIMAAIRRQSDVAFGNIVGSNIFNILGIGGATAVVSPLAVPGSIIQFDIWVMLATALLLVAFAITGWRISRTEALALLMAYAAYLVVQLSPGTLQVLSEA